MLIEYLEADGANCPVVMLEYVFVEVTLYGLDHFLLDILAHSTAEYLAEYPDLRMLLQAVDQQIRTRP